MGVLSIVPAHCPKYYAKPVYVYFVNRPLGIKPIILIPHFFSYPGQYFIGHFLGLFCANGQRLVYFV